ncbi:hypothetical protein OHA21_21080 [Actinoplanes sp. NBC_00393]|uniref:hypothetical protein n=1 Tax=Actinoplanes sp. NBC_00393 TaxID=2975953 RepID=UPI002E1E132F
MRWTPDGTIRDALWIGGGQWSGKTTVAAILTGRHGLTHMHCDYQDSRAYEDRRFAARVRRGEPPIDWTRYWLELSPREMADLAVGNVAEQFPWVLDDLRALVSARPVVVDGWNLRPDLVVTVADPRRMVVLVPTDDWRRHQAATLARAVAFGADLPDPDRARRNRLERDRLLAADAARQARAQGIPVIEVDGDRDADSIADQVADCFGAAL